MEKIKNNPIEEIMSSTMSNLKSIVDVNTIVGEPIVNEFGVTILPISKVTMGFVSGGGEYPNLEKLKKVKVFPFAGGCGAGVSLTPLGFLTIVGNVPNFVRVENRTSWDKIGDLLPELLEKLLGNKSNGSNNHNSQATETSKTVETVKTEIKSEKTGRKKNGKKI